LLLSILAIINNKSVCQSILSNIFHESFSITQNCNSRVKTDYPKLNA
jgi:hypothetical protein